MEDNFDLLQYLKALAAIKDRGGPITPVKSGVRAPQGQIDTNTGIKQLKKYLSTSDEPLAQSNPIDAIFGEGALANLGSLENIEAGPSKAIMLGNAFPKTYHGTRAPLGARQLIDEGVNMGKANVGDILGSVFHHTPNKSYAQEFASTDGFGSPKKDALLALRMEPNSKVLNLIPQNYVSGHNAIASRNAEDFKNVVPEQRDTIKSLLRRFGQDFVERPNEPRIEEQLNTQALTDVLRSNPNEVTKLGIDHIAYMDGAHGAIATPRVDKLIVDETNKPLRTFNKIANAQKVFRDLEGGPIKNWLEHPKEFETMPNRFVWNVDKMRQIGPQAGSNKGGRFTVPGIGKREVWYTAPDFYVKSNPNEDVVMNEFWAHLLQNKFTGSGILPKLGRWQEDPAIMVPWQAHATPTMNVDNRDFTRDVVMRNWDVGEPGNIVDLHNWGAKWRPDLGGALYRRAQGALKPGKLAETAAEDLRNMQDPYVSPNTAQLYKNSHIDQYELRNMEEALSYPQVGNYPSKNYQLPEQLVSDILQRIKDLQKFAR